MIKLRWAQPESISDVRALVQTAIELEFATLPPYLYAKFSILPESNPAALGRLNAIVGQEMIHLCLACNILNAIGGTPVFNPPHYPGPLPGDVNAKLVVHLLPFSEGAMDQGMAIEEPVEEIGAKDEKVYVASYWKLMWWRFLKHRMAVVKRLQNSHFSPSCMVICTRI